MAKSAEMDAKDIVALLLLGIFFWKKGRGNPGLAEYMGEKRGCQFRLLPAVAINTILLQNAPPSDRTKPGIIRIKLAAIFHTT
jgi:hypothetical protein